MRLDDPKFEHPKFKRYLDFDFPDVSKQDKDGKDTKIVTAVANFGKMSNEQARKYLSSGTDPVLWVFKDITRSESLTEFPKRLLVPLDMVAAFEADDKSAKRLTKKGLKVFSIGLFLIESVIAGHLTKFSDDNKDSDPANWNKAFAKFEQEVYGGF